MTLWSAMGLGPQWIAKLWAICHCQSMIEVCVSFLLFTAWLSVFQHAQTGGNKCTPTAQMTVFRALVVSKLVRTLAAAAVTDAARRGPRWPKVCLLCGVSSLLTLCGEIFCVLAWQTACSPKDLGRAPMACTTMGMALDSLIAFASFVCSGLWFVTTFPKSPRMPPLPVASFVVHDVPTECGDIVCSICLDEFAPDCRAARLPCGHIFHDACVREWLKTGRNCPMRCPHPHAAVARQGGSLPAGRPSEHDPVGSHEEADRDRQEAFVV